MIINNKITEQVWMLGNKNDQKFLPSLSWTEIYHEHHLLEVVLSKSGQYHTWF